MHSPGREILGWQRSACTGRRGRRGLVLYRSVPVLVSVTVLLGCADLLRWLGRREGGCTHEHMSGVNRNTYFVSHRPSTEWVHLHIYYTHHQPKSVSLTSHTHCRVQRMWTARPQSCAQTPFRKINQNGSGHETRSQPRHPRASPRWGRDCTSRLS